MILNVGLTGNIGSGKSTVAHLFVERGAALIDADALAREATEDPAVLRQIVDAFGERVLRAGGLDRAALGQAVFRNAEARARLNAIVHPWVARERARRVTLLSEQASPPTVIIHDVPLLFEVGLDAVMDRNVVVDAPLALRMARVGARSGLTEAEVRARDAAQEPLADKVKRADFVIDNSGGEGALEPQVACVWDALVGAVPKEEGDGNPSP